VLAVTRYRVTSGAAASFLERAEAALDALSAQPGWGGGRLGRATDDPDLWCLVTEWADVGSYRRALGAYDVKVRAVPLLASAVDEPTAFEILRTSASDGAAGAARTRRAADASSVGVGDAAAPVVPTDLD
jgi:quinol monooxygenase YgiN